MVYVERETGRVRVWCIVIDEVHVVHTEVRACVRGSRWAGGQRARARIVTRSSDRCPIYPDGVLRTVVGRDRLPKQCHGAKPRYIDLLGVVA